MSARIKAISYVVPEYSLSNEMIAKEHPEWPMEKIYEKTGIKNRYISSQNEYSLELGIKAGMKLLQEHHLNPESIDFVIFCTQTPKFLIPTSACIIQNRLGIPITAGALDINQGCSGYIYSLMMAESLINNKRAKNILLITSDTYTKLIDNQDRSLKTIFGDAASASLITADRETSSSMNFFEFGSDGADAEKLISRNSGLQGLMENQTYIPDLYMDGKSIFNFTLKTVPAMVNQLLEKANYCITDIDLFVFHQANEYMLEHLRQKIGIATDKFYINMQNTGNVVSSSIPIALSSAIKTQKIQPKHKVMLVGFGVGLSWASTIVEF